MYVVLIKSLHVRMYSISDGVFSGKESQVQCDNLTPHNSTCTKLYRSHYTHFGLYVPERKDGLHMKGPSYRACYVTATL